VAEDRQPPAVEASLERVQQLVEGFVRARAVDDADDVVQESLTRLLESKDRLHPSAWGPYAVITARNLLVSRERERETAGRHRHRLYDPGALDSPEQGLLLQEEHRDLTRALDSLPAGDRELLLQRYSQHAADSSRSLPAATAARLARARARLRVAYLVQHGRVQLPTSRCRPVLEALTSGDRRRQERLGAARHLLACPVCAAHSAGLVARRRASIGLHPLAWTGAGLAWGWRQAREHRATATAAAVAVSAVTVAGVVAVTPVGEPGGSAPAPAPSPAATTQAVGTLTIGDVTVLPVLPPGPLPTGPAVGRAVPVADVPADEGFWVGGGAGQRLWVQVVTSTESAVQVRPGDRVSFVGRALPAGPQLAQRAGLTGREGADELADLGVYVEVRQEDLVVTPP
jgi:RNA polymerase sigma factor (sigma-70 family)